MYMFVCVCVRVSVWHDRLFQTSEVSRRAEKADHSRDEAAGKWKLHSRSCRAKLGLSDAFSAWTERESFAGEGLQLTPRIRDVLDLTAAKALNRAGPGKGLKDIYVDVSQSLDRNCFSNAAGIVPCFTSSTELYSYGQDRVILPEEMLAMHGFGTVTVPDSVDIRDLKRMAGTGMSLPCLGTVPPCISRDEHKAALLISIERCCTHDGGAMNPSCWVPLSTK